MHPSGPPELNYATGHVFFSQMRTPAPRRSACTRTIPSASSPARWVCSPPTRTSDTPDRPPIEQRWAARRQSPVALDRTAHRRAPAVRPVGTREASARAAEGCVDTLAALWGLCHAPRTATGARFRQIVVGHLWGTRGPVHEALQPADVAASHPTGPGTRGVVWRCGRAAWSPLPVAHVSPGWWRHPVRA
jgi:hypothetical protein